MKAKEEYIVLPFRLDNKLYRKLKKISFLTEKPMAVIVREGVEIIVKDYKKVLTSGDIAI